MTIQTPPPDTADQAAPLDALLTDAALDSATQLLAAGTDLNTVAGRLGHAEGSTTLKFYAQFTRPADQAAAIVIPSQLDGLRKKERLRELYYHHLSASGGDGLAALAAVIGPQAGLEEDTALAWLTEFAAMD